MNARTRATDLVTRFGGEVTAGNQPGTKQSWIAELLKAVRNPMVFNALAIVVMAWLVSGGTRLEFAAWRVTFLGIGVVFTIGVTAWLNYFAWKNPRFLAYGPDEYLHESELDHERRMKGM